MENNPENPRPDLRTSPPLYRRSTGWSKQLPALRPFESTFVDRQHHQAPPRPGRQNYESGGCVQNLKKRDRNHIQVHKFMFILNFFLDFLAETLDSRNRQAYNCIQRGSLTRVKRRRKARSSETWRRLQQAVDDPETSTDAPISNYPRTSPGSRIRGFVISGRPRPPNAPRRSPAAPAIRNTRGSRSRRAAHRPVPRPASAQRYPA